MNIQKIIKIHSEILNNFDLSKEPADIIIGKFFLNHKFIGSKERKLLSDLAFNFIRNKLLLKYFAESIAKTFPLTDTFNSNILMSLINIIFCEFNFNEFSKIKPSDFFTKFYTNMDDFFADLSNTISEIIPNSDINILKNDLKKLIDELDHEIFNRKFSDTLLMYYISIRYSINEDLLILLKKTNYFRNHNDLLTFANSTLYPAKTHLRISKPSINKQTVIDELNSKEIKYNFGEYSDNAIILNDRTNLLNLDAYKNGLVEIQDETSQLITYSLGLTGDEKVWDACAGAGGKALHIFEYLGLKGTLVATDTNKKKLDELYNRLRKSGNHGIKIHSITNNNLSILEKYNGFDVILIDAPCSGSGTYKRNPQKLLTYDKENIKQFAQKQTGILNSYAKFLKTGGKLLYVTCSLYREENEAIINKFINQNRNFSGLSLKQNFQKHNINIQNLQDDEYQYTFHPENSQSDGFFISLLQKNS